jgi:phage shock protein PspC (stress-responsive transcriptional regulator)
MTRLYRSERDKKLFGLCGGLAEKLNLDVTLLRLVVVVSALFSAGTVIALYVIASLIIPKESEVLLQESGYGAQNSYQSQAYTYQSAEPVKAKGETKSTAKHAEFFYTEQTSTSIDEMMKEIEKKALLREIEELKSKLNQYEKGAI